MQAEPKGTSNESVLAIQPHQADQPADLDADKASPEGQGGLWRTLLIWGGVVLGILSVAAGVAPLCSRYSRLRPPTFSDVAPPMVQRLVGEFLSAIFHLFFSLI